MFANFRFFPTRGMGVIKLNKSDKGWRVFLKSLVEYDKGGVLLDPSNPIFGGHQVGTAHITVKR